MTGKDDGGSAFPIPAHLHEGRPDSYWSTHPHPGMSLRDWLAGMAMNGFAARPDAEIELLAFRTELSATDAVSVEAYEYADRMLAERRKGDADGPDGG